MAKGTCNVRELWGKVLNKIVVKKKFLGEKLPNEYDLHTK